jgi:hypothetical protein
MLRPEDYYLFPMVLDAAWWLCKHCSIRDARTGIGGRLVQCVYCLNTRTSLDAKDMPPWLLALISDQNNHYAYDLTDDYWFNDSARVPTSLGVLEFLAWIRGGQADSFQSKNFFEEIKSGDYTVYDKMGKTIGKWVGATQAAVLTVCREWHI